jgi:hypothetical protein
MSVYGTATYVTAKQVSNEKEDWPQVVCERRPRVLVRKQELLVLDAAYFTKKPKVPILCIIT